MPSLITFRRDRIDAPLEVLRESLEWAPVIGIFADWAAQPLDRSSGYSSDELDVIEGATGILLPMVLREWWRLAGKHPFVDPGLDPSGCQCFMLPTDRKVLGSQEGLTFIAFHDSQSGVVSGIHDDFIHDPDPPTHGVNDITRNGEIPEAAQYRDHFYSNDINVPTLIRIALLSMLYSQCERYLGHPSKMLRPGSQLNESGCVYRDETGPSELLSLTKFSIATSHQDIFTDGTDVVYWRLFGYLCRTPEAARKVEDALRSS